MGVTVGALGGGINQAEWWIVTVRVMNRLRPNLVITSNLFVPDFFNAF